MRLLTLAALAAPLALSALALAAPTGSSTWDCDNGYIALPMPSTGVWGGHGVAYLYPVYDKGFDGWPYSVGAYMESNGEPGLQRGGVSLIGDLDYCQGSLNPDLMVY